MVANELRLPLAAQAESAVAQAEQCVDFADLSWPYVAGADVLDKLLPSLESMVQVTTLQKLLIELLEKPRFYWARYKHQTSIEPVKLAYREEYHKLMIEVLGADDWRDLSGYTLLARIPDYKAD